LVPRPGHPARDGLPLVLVLVGLLRHRPDGQHQLRQVDQRQHHPGRLC